MKFSTIIATGLTTSQSAAAFFAGIMAPVSSLECQMDCGKQYADRRYYTPVCGSDGNTYANQCVLERISCLRGLNLEIVHEGECTVSRIARRSADCPQFCHRMFAPVCGSDGETYPNSCVLQQTACSAPELNLFEVADGECSAVELKFAGNRHTDPNTTPTTEQFAFPVMEQRLTPMICNRMYAPVCGSNGITYSNECMLNADSFERNLDITKLHDGECDAEHTDEQVSAQECSLMCTREFNPVCGQFGDQFRIYGNPCELGVASCLTNGAVVQVDPSKCQNENDLKTTFQLKKSGKRNSANKKSGSKKRRGRNGPIKDVSKISKLGAFLNRN
jgi:hypothetical protein